MALPAQYQWLNKIGVLPKMVAEGIKFIGLKEIPGKTHNPTIVSWGDRIGCGAIVNDDEQAWCGLFIAYLATITGKFIPMQGWNILRALQWVHFGTKVSSPVLGDVLIFGRAGGGHVALYIGEDDSHYHILGGNQNNSVGIMRKSKTDLRAIRRPPYNQMPASCKAYKLKPLGEALVSAA